MKKSSKVGAKFKLSRGSLSLSLSLGLTHSHTHVRTHTLSLSSSISHSYLYTHLLTLHFYLPPSLPSIDNFGNLSFSVNAQKLVRGRVELMMAAAAIGGQRHSKQDVDDDFVETKQKQISLELHQCWRTCGVLNDAFELLR